MRTAAAERGRRGAPPRVRRLAATVLAALVPAAAQARPASAQDTHLLVVAGLGGTPEHSERFLGWAGELHRAAVDRLGLAPERVSVLVEDPDAAPFPTAGRSTLQDLSSTAAAVASRAGPDDRVLIVLIGHGSQRDGVPRFNLPGPDLTAEDAAVLMDAFGERRVALVNAASASGEFIPLLSAPGRAVVTATASGRERNETVFAGPFVEALGSEAADLDRDGRLSLLEAYEWARREVERHYEEEGLLLTEHARLDDDGDGRGTGEPGPDAGDGSLAGVFWIGRAAGAATAAASAAESDDPVLRRLAREKAALEERIAALRARSGDMEPAAYDAALEELLVELALKNREIRERQGGP